MEIYHPSPNLVQIYTNPQQSDGIKAAGNALKSSAGCSKCQLLESDTTKLMKCARCKISLYCSKECQTADWPTHKSECAITADQKLHTITDLLNFFLGNRFLHSYLELALILELGLEPMTGLDQLHTAQFYVGIEPCDIADFKRIWSPMFYFDPSKKVKMEGMFQLLGLSSSSAHPQNVPNGRSRVATPDIANIRREADTIGHGGDAVVQCEFLAMTDGIVSMKFVTVTIGQGAFGLAEQLDKITVSEGIDKPLTAATCLEFINMHIRQDAANQLRLRSRMNVNDVRMINYTRNMVTKPARDSTENWIETYKQTLKGKVERESIYFT